MANHKSALKRNRQSLVRRARNRVNKSKVKTAVRAVREALEQGSVDQAQAALNVAIPVIQRAATKGTLHKKTASRKVSRLARQVHALSVSQ